MIGAAAEHNLTGVLLVHVFYGLVFHVDVGLHSEWTCDAAHDFWQLLFGRWSIALLCVHSWLCYLLSDGF